MRRVVGLIEDCVMYSTGSDKNRVCKVKTFKRWAKGSKLINAAERWRVYESEKQAFIALNPGATPEQYEAAMRAIAKRVGI